MTDRVEQEAIEKFIDLLKQGKIKPDHSVKGSDDWGTSRLSLLQYVINCDYVSVSEKIGYIKTMISLGCDVDQMVSNWSPLEMAVSGGSDDGYIEMATELLKHHKFGDLTDLNILKSAAKSITIGMFELVIDSKKVDINATRLHGSHILHYLAEESSFASSIGIIIIRAPEIEVNPINRHGFSPLAIAINKENVSGMKMLKGHKDAKIIGKLHEPELVVAYDLVDRYDGNFFGDFPKMIEFAIKMGRTHLIPKEVSDIFLF